MSFHIRLTYKPSKIATSKQKINLLKLYTMKSTIHELNSFKIKAVSKTLKIILTLCVLIISSTIFAQTEGTIKGTVVDEKNIPMPFAPVAVLQDSTIIASTQTDVNGEFTIKNLTPGKYNIKSFFTSYNTTLLEKVSVNLNQIRYVTMNMSLTATGLPPVVVSAVFIEPAFDAKFSTVTPISITQIENAAVGKTDIVQLVLMTTPGILETPDGKDLYVRGSRRGSTGYYVDGNKTMSVPEVPGMGISGMEVLTGGVPAMYGDCTGGLVIITTKEYKWEMNRQRNKIEDRKERDAAEKRQKAETKKIAK